LFLEKKKRKAVPLKEGGKKTGPEMPREKKGKEGGKQPHHMRVGATARKGKRG